MVRGAAGKVSVVQGVSAEPGRGRKRGGRAWKKSRLIRTNNVKRGRLIHLSTTNIFVLAHFPPNAAAAAALLTNGSFIT